MKKIISILLSVLLFASCGKYEEVTFSGVESFKVVSLSQTGAEVEITAKIKNPNKYGFTIYPSEFDTQVSGINLGKAKLTNRTRIKANSEQAYTFKLKSDFSKLSISDLPKIMGLAKSKNVAVSLKGNLKGGKLFVKKSIPVDFTRNVPLSGF